MNTQRPEPSPLTDNAPRDLFRTAPPALIPHGQDVYIIGTGPSLTHEVLTRIPRTAWVAVLNKGILDAPRRGLSLLSIKAWFCATPEYWRNADWWRWANDFAMGRGIPRVFSWQLAAQGINCEHTFYNCPGWADADAPDGLIPGVLRGDGTIAAAPMQWAAHCHARRIVLGGIDMSGDLYCDGSTNPRHEKDTEWDEATTLARATRACQATGIPVATLTPTALSNYGEIEQL